MINLSWLQEFAEGIQKGTFGSPTFQNRIQFIWKAINIANTVMVMGFTALEMLCSEINMAGVSNIVMSHR